MTSFGIYKNNVRLLYQMSEDGEIRTQHGIRDRSGKIRYSTYNLGKDPSIALRVYNGARSGRGLIKRLSYKPSKYSSWHELLKQE